jgi:hypothetical protein
VRLTTLGRMVGVPIFPNLDQVESRFPATGIGTAVLATHRVSNLSRFGSHNKNQLYSQARRKTPKKSLCVQVIWVDLLTKEEFENGFGSHTPMYSGQTKCVRYYMNFERSLRLLKEIMLKVPPPPSSFLHTHPCTAGRRSVCATT